jgi:Rod binding domain-containing protein
MDISQLLSPSQAGQGYETLQISREANLRDAVGSANKDEQLKAAARQFESVFVNQILKQMQETIQEASFDPEDSSNQQVHGMYCTFLADAVSERGGFGLWETIYEQLSQQQAAAGGAETVDAKV